MLKDNFTENTTNQIDEKQNFVVLAVPCNRAFVVAPEMVEEFKNQRPDPEIMQQMKKMHEIVEKYNVNINDGPILKKTIWPNKK